MKNKVAELNKITREISRCNACKRSGIGKPVPGEGSSNARIVFIGEAPGRTEAKVGRPFIGGAGKFFRPLIRYLGLKESEVFITNPVKYLPRRGTPGTKEILHGKIHLEKQLAIINPKVIVLLGNVAARALLNEKPSALKKHGSSVKRSKRLYFITIHPAAVLRFPKFKKIIRADFRKLKKLLVE